MRKVYKCIVNKIIYNKGMSITNIVTGIKKDKQYKYEGKYKGGNGSYCTGFDNYPSELKAKIYVCDLNKYIYLDIKEYALSTNGRVKITDKMVNKLNELNSGKRVYFEFEDGCIVYNISNLSKLDVLL